MKVVELAPVVKTIDVRRSARDAFRLFTDEIGAWWPLRTHTRAQREKGQESVHVTIEPKVGGRIYETLRDGQQLDWGEVLAFEPGRLFRMQWRLGRPVEQATEVTVRFDACDAASCRVTLTHEKWENLGEEAEAAHGAYSGGWVTVFEDRFGDYAGRA